MSASTPVFFHPEQLAFRPRWEWRLGGRIRHPEQPERAARILAALEGDARFPRRRPGPLPDEAWEGVHDPALPALYRAAARLPAGEEVTPSVFLGDVPTPARAGALRQAGRWCFDTGTPLARETWRAARWSAASAWAGAGALLAGAPRAYALCRPPGHHAGRARYGGYCYLNNAALAAARLRPEGRVALVDLDFHHGNGTQELFWRDPRVLVLSLHADPEASYPFLTGWASERGAGPGRGATLNVPLPLGSGGEAWLAALRRRALPALRRFAPEFLVVSLGLDVLRGDPFGGFLLAPRDLGRALEALGALGRPTLVVQEGGYRLPALGAGVRAALLGLQRGQARD